MIETILPKKENFIDILDNNNNYSIKMYSH